MELKKRFDRIIEILVQLQSKKVVKAQELADRFEVSLRTIYRDIKSLESAGIPIIGEAGTGYSIVECFRLPPIMFTKEEAMSFIGAEKLMEKFMDDSLISHYKSAMYKVRSVLKHNARDTISNIEKHIIMREGNFETFNRLTPHALQTLFESMAHKQQVSLSYKGTQDEYPKIRTIEPIGLYHENNFWYVGAYCLTRNDYRQFRTDRIYTIDLLTESFSQDHISLPELMKKSENNCEIINIKVRVGKDTAPYLEWQKKQFGFTCEDICKDHIDLSFAYKGPIEYFARWFMMYADDAQIIYPPALKDIVKNILTKSMDCIKNETT